MIVALSTSSPMASVALIVDGRVVASESRSSGHAAAEACLEMLEICLKQAGRSLTEATHFAADLGPGSFIGVRVGVTLTKTLAFNQGCRCYGATAFALLGDETTYVPSRKGQWFLHTGSSTEVVEQIPDAAVGYGYEGKVSTYPDATKFADLIPNLIDQSAESLVPFYLSEPSISTPKKPYATLP